MKINTFVFDLDGTLLNSNDRISEGVIKVLLKAREQGKLLIVCTGRPLEDIMEPLKEAGEGLFDYAILNNGTYMIDLKTDKITNNAEIDKSVVKEYVRLGRKYKTLFSIHFDGIALRGNLFDDEPKWFTEAKKEEKYLLIHEKKSIHIDEALEKSSGSKLCMLSLRTTAENAHKILAEFNQTEFKEKAKMIVASKTYSDIIPLNMNKYIGLKLLLDKLNIDISDVISFGDSGNDIEMIEKTGLGIAMGNAIPEVKAAADEVIGDNDSDAIEKRLIELMENNSN